MKSTHKQKNFFVSAIIRLLVIIGITLVLFVVGMMIGYSMLGEGNNPFEVFQPSTWEHIKNFVQ